MKSQDYFSQFSQLRTNLKDDIQILLRDKMRLHHKLSLDVFYYTDVEEVVDKPAFPTCDKNGYGVLVFVSSIEYGKREWKFNMDNEDSESWDDWYLSSNYDFSTEGLANLLELLENIFNYCEENNKPLVGVGDYDYTNDCLAR